MATEKQECSHIRQTKQRRSSQTDEELSFFVPPTFSSLATPSFTREVITIDDGDEEETLEPKKKKSRLGSWWDDLDDINELSIVVKGLPKPKDAAASIVGSSFSSTNLHETMTKNKEGGERSLSSCFHKNNQEHQERVGYGQEVSLKEPVDSCFSSSRTDLPEPETNTNKDHERSLLSSSHHGDNFIDYREEEIVSESTNSGNRHVSLEEFGVSVEDLKSMPWEAFDPTWEIRSEIMDPWLGGYIKDMISTHH